MVSAQNQREKAVYSDFRYCFLDILTHFDYWSNVSEAEVLHRLAKFLPITAWNISVIFHFVSKLLEACPKACDTDGTLPHVYSASRSSKVLRNTENAYFLKIG